MEVHLWIMGVALTLGVVYSNEDGTMFLPDCDGDPCFGHSRQLFTQLCLN